METLEEQFNNMRIEPMFENENDGEYYIYYIKADDRGLEAEGATNTGFSSMGLEIVDWNNCFSLDEHLQSLYDICYEDAIKQAD